MSQRSQLYSVVANAGSAATTMLEHVRQGNSKRLRARKEKFGTVSGFRCGVEMENNNIVVIIVVVIQAFIWR